MNWWRRQAISLLLSILAWGASLGLLTLIYRADRQSSLGWHPDSLTMFVLWASATVLFGTVFWVITVAIDVSALRSLPYGVLILLNSFAVLLCVLLFWCIRVAVVIIVGGEQPSVALADGAHLATTPLMGLLYLYVWLTSVALVFLRQVSALLGTQVLLNLLLGKYRQPKVETRIFMFIDLESSTGIAERIGHEGFCRLIQECFIDLAEVTIRRSVEIYRYVGDEAILTWLPSRGLQDCNCLRVFFEFQQGLARRAEFYQQNFGLLPKFKAGANIGEVTVAEIGVFKREITYLSDVLNTAARLESQCRGHGADLLITQDLQNALGETSDLIRERVGDLQLRGKTNRVGVYLVEEC